MSLAKTIRYEARNANTLLFAGLEPRYAGYFDQFFRQHIQHASGNYVLARNFGRARVGRAEITIGVTS